ncbi:hypothetical protein Pfo_016777 [Paulownia fortunei]|nr:hypothetical protein Pfo_016777 [Paulownia fortunei]
MACLKLNCIILQGSRHLIICLLAFGFLLLPTLTPIHFMAQGRQISKLSDATMRRNQEKVVIMRSVIGSRPPRCDERCKSCGHCEAVQVPIVPIKKFFIQQAKSSHFYATPRIAYSRGDDITNYKPMCWKCKCGDFIFNPW